MDGILLVHIAATWAMVGLIWFVQLVHYPLFRSVGADEFEAYQAQHTRRTAQVVGVLMPVEAVTAAWLVADTPVGIDGRLAVVGVVLVAALWLSTALWQAPIHGRLSRGFDVSLQRVLVRSNWLRTAAWSVRGVLVLIIGGQALG